MKIFKFNSMFSGEKEGYLVKNTYLNNKNLYIGVMSKAEHGGYEPWGDLSKNIIKFDDKTMVAIDTNNLYSDILEVLVAEGVLVSTNRSLTSGFCTYPVYRVTDKFAEWCE